MIDITKRIETDAGYEVRLISKRPLRRAKGTSEAYPAVWGTEVETLCMLHPSADLIVWGREVRGVRNVPTKRVEWRVMSRGIVGGVDYRTEAAAEAAARRVGGTAVKLEVKA